MLQLLPSAAGAVIAIAFIHNLLRRHPSCSVLVNKPVNPHSAVAASVAAPKPTAAQAAAHKSTDPAEQHTVPDAMTNGHAHDSSHASSREPDADSSDAEAADMAVDKAQAADERGAQTAAATATASATATSTAQAVGGDMEAGEDVFDETEVDPAKCRAIESSLWELESLRHHYYHTVRHDCHDKVHQGACHCSCLMHYSLMCQALVSECECEPVHGFERLCKAIAVQGLALIIAQFVLMGIGHNSSVAIPIA